MLKQLLREPLLHFLVLALLIFGAYRALAPAGPEAQAGRIVVSAGRIGQLASVFAKTWQRPPTAGELKALIDGYVREEIYVREALALGLDRDDTVIRRRLQQKMEFMNDATADALAPTDADLEAYLNAHPETFTVDPLTAFEQVYFNPGSRGQTLEADVDAALGALAAGTSPEAVGDVSLLPPTMALSSQATIGETFGPEFAQAVGEAPAGDWVGPIESAFGLHLVRVSQHKAGRVPVLAEVRDAVLREWSRQRRVDLEAARMDDLLKRYDVRVEAAPASDASP